jgi:plastocyanin
MRAKAWFVAAIALAIGIGLGYLLFARDADRRREKERAKVEGEVGSQTAESSQPKVKPRPAPPGSIARPTPAIPRSNQSASAVDGGAVASASQSAEAEPQAGSQRTSEPGAVVPWTGIASAIEGEVHFAGAVPVAGKLHREADPYCARVEMTDPTVLVSNGKLANVWVHVVNGPPAPPSATTLEIDQKDCMYTPRVTAAVVGEKIVARNGDPVLHNVHTYVDASTLFNRGMPNDKAAPIEFSATQEGVIKWKCDVHPWMRGYTGVSRNPYQAVTGTDGTFRIANVPAGRYTVEAWHEKYGLKSVEITAPAHVVFTYDGTQ